MVLPLLLALSVTASDAICAVRGWTRQGGTLTVIGAPVKADRFETASGNAFYAVKTSEGTVFTSADTDYEPILAFTSSVADFSEIDPASPLWALMTKSADNAVYSADAFARWQELLAKGEFRRILLATSQGIDTSDIGDIRVEPLTKSKWGQGINGVKGSYNYYTPGYSLCGCVATAMAQVMYCHKYPVGATVVTNKCSYGGTDKIAEYSILAGDYKWDSMAEGDGTAIGKLTYDCGVATHMHWNFENQKHTSATYNEYAEAAFYEVFGYKSATYVTIANNHLATGDNLQKAVLSNLDAGYPVMIGISNSENPYEGHSLVVDGYGYKDSNIYVHLNLGWSGSEDMWYHIPDLGTKAYAFDTIGDIVYNIIPGGTVKATFSGRVTDANGHGVAKLPLTIYSGNNIVTNLLTNSHGVFGFASTPFSNYKVVVAECADYLAATNSNRRLDLPIIESNVYFEDEYLGENVIIDRYVKYAYKIGNSWGNDLGLKTNTKTDQTISANAGEENVSIPLAWFIDEGVATGNTPTMRISEVAAQTASNGINSVAECYVIGISPTNETAQFTAEISFSPDGTVKIEHDPDLKDRTYTTKYSIDLKTWYDWTGETPEGAFFKVEVSK